jgi:Family of unknown function (DUF6210)
MGEEYSRALQHFFASSTLPEGFSVADLTEDHLNKLAEILNHIEVSGSLLDDPSTDDAQIQLDTSSLEFLAEGWLPVMWASRKAVLLFPNSD